MVVGSHSGLLSIINPPLRVAPMPRVAQAMPRGSGASSSIDTLNLPPPAFSGPGHPIILRTIKFCQQNYFALPWDQINKCFNALLYDSPSTIWYSEHRPRIFLGSTMTFLTWQKVQFLGGLAIHSVGISGWCTITLNLACNMTILLRIAGPFIGGVRNIQSKRNKKYKCYH